MGGWGCGAVDIKRELKGLIWVVGSRGGTGTGRNKVYLYKTKPLHCSGPLLVHYISHLKICAVIF